MTNEPVITAPLMLCEYCSTAQGFNAICQKLATWNEPSDARVKPTGCCIHASVTMMKYPESHEPRKTMKAAPQCAHLLRRCSPKRKRPRKADSRKKE